MDLSLKVEGYADDDATWLGSSHGTSSGRSATLDLTAFTEATHYPDGYLPSGLPLGRIMASGLYGPYDAAATDGTEVLAGFLLTACTATPRDGATTTVVGALLDHGRVKVANLPVAFTPPTTAANNATTIVFWEV
ncbi:head decoration protein [Nocardiopsis sp. NPDC006139]|uniref:head decoration protein n=1 Tax=Nocardiopsis sp. NPDC006139 TaxID=3154578 RepID=UPI0033B011F9